MTDIAWFIFRGQSHAVDKTKEKLATVCGLIPVASFAPEVTTLGEGNWPPDTCPRCLVILGSDQTDDEPLREALDRGYVASRDLPVGSPAPLPEGV